MPLVLPYYLKDGVLVQGQPYEKLGTYHIYREPIKQTEPPDILVTYG